MKATGIVRPLDNLGRIVLPIELRRTLNIRPGDKVEIFTEDNGYVLLRKFCYQGDVLEAVDKIESYTEEMTPAKAEAVQRLLKDLRTLVDSDEKKA